MSSTEAVPAAPRPLPAMWRALKRGYRAEPWLISVSFGLVAAGGPARRADRPVAQAAGRRGRRRERPARAHGLPRPRRLGGGHLVPLARERPHPAALPRPGDHRPRVPRGRPAGLGRHHRAPRAARVPRPPGGAARPGVRARPHVHVALHHLRLGAAPRRHPGAAGVTCTPPWRCWRSSPCPRCSPPPGGRGSSGPPRSAARPPSVWRGTSSTPPPPPRPARRCGSPASVRAWWRSGARPGSAGTARWPPRARAAPSGTAWAGRSSARAYVAAVVFVSCGPARLAGRRAAGARRRRAPLGLHRRHRRRDRLPARHLARRLAAHGLARGLRGLAGRGRRRTRPGAPAEGHPLRARLVRLSRHRPPRARGRGPRAAGRAAWWPSSARTAPARRRW